MGENYDDLINDVKSRWILIRSKQEGATSAQILDFILAELERNDLKTRILEKKVEKIIDFIKKFGKNDAKVTRNLEKLLKRAKVIPTLPIKKGFKKRGEEWVQQERK